LEDNNQDIENWYHSVLMALPTARQLRVGKSIIFNRFRDSGYHYCENEFVIEKMQKICDRPVLYFASLSGQFNFSTVIGDEFVSVTDRCVQDELSVEVRRLSPPGRNDLWESVFSTCGGQRGFTHESMLAFFNALANGLWGDQYVTHGKFGVAVLSVDDQ
jgi:hypothetical protein